jgi:hypothetical protein
LQISNNNFSVSYFAFELKNLSIAKIIESLFNIQDNSIIKCLRWLPTIDYFKILVAGNISNPDGEYL